MNFAKMGTWGLMLIVLGLGSSGCCGKLRGLSRGKTSKTSSGTTSTVSPTPDTGPKAKEGPVVLTVTNHDITVSTGGRGNLLTFDKDGRLAISFSGLPGGTKIKAGSEEVTVEGHRSARITPDIKAALGTASLELGSTFDPKISVSVTLPDGRSGSIDLPPQRMNTYALGQLLKEASGKGVTFEGEAPDTKRDTAFMASGGRAIGRKGVVRDIDVVVTLAKGTMKGTKNCSGYKSKDGSMRSVTLELFEGEAVAFDRRTGAEIARKTLPPNSVCPMTLYQAKDDPTADSNLPTTAAEKWAATLLKK